MCKAMTPANISAKRKSFWNLWLVDVSKVMPTMFGDGSQMLFELFRLTGWAFVWSTSVPVGELTDTKNKVKITSPVYSKKRTCWMAWTASEKSSSLAILIPGCRDTSSVLEVRSSIWTLFEIRLCFLYSFHLFSCAQHVFEEGWLCYFLPILEYYVSPLNDIQSAFFKSFFLSFLPSFLHPLQDNIYITVCWSILWILPNNIWSYLKVT